MTRSKKIFILAAILFLAALLYASYDISRKTSFPGSKGQLKERLRQQYATDDSTKADSLKEKPQKN
jgi:hypothetical protein